MKLVLLAAGHGKRFGGLKQIAPVGASGEAIMDYTARFAEAAGYDGIVLVVREEIREELLDHVRRTWSSEVPVETVVQPQRPGTAYAVLCTAGLVDGPFAVANADDLYEQDALAAILDHFDDGQSSAPSVLVAYELTNTVLTDAEVKRGVCRVGAGDRLDGVVEHKVRLRGDGRFDAAPLREANPGAPAHSTVLGGEELVSMNLWGFSPEIFTHLEAATAPHEPDGPDHEILLPDVLGALVASKQSDVRVVTTTSRCFGITHKDDVPLVREHLEMHFGEGSRPAGLAAER